VSPDRTDAISLVHRLAAHRHPQHHAHQAAAPVAAPRASGLAGSAPPFAGAAPARFLLLSAQPLHEPAVRYGPFVMNTREEIAQALHELRNGTFIRP
jgi:hypothetical protein